MHQPPRPVGYDQPELQLDHLEELYRRLDRVRDDLAPTLAELPGELRALEGLLAALYVRIDRRARQGAHL